MINICEYLLGKKFGKQTLAKFPEKPIEDDVMNFLEYQGFERKNFEKVDFMNSKTESKIIKKLERSKKSSYIFIDRPYANYNIIFFSKYGKITEDNPCVEILVYEDENDIDSAYICGKFYFDSTAYCKLDREYDHKEYEKLVEDINKYFEWENL